MQITIYTKFIIICFFIPPDTEGVCTDVIWRAFKNAGYSLKDMVDEDIKNNFR